MNILIGEIKKRKAVIPPVVHYERTRNGEYHASNALLSVRHKRLVGNSFTEDEGNKSKLRLDKAIEEIKKRDTSERIRKLK